MMLASVLIVDDDPERLTRSRAWLQTSPHEILEATSERAALALAKGRKPDLVLLCPSLGIELFRKLSALSEESGTFIVPLIEGRISPDLRKQVLAWKADGFISEEWPGNEKSALVDALLRNKKTMDELKQRMSPAPANSNESKKAVLEPNRASESSELPRPLRERSPDLYKDLQGRYEGAVKLVLQNRIYKINDDVFEPFRQIARQLFQADATARDAVELHYHTLRKIAPTPDAPRAQAYLEVGRTTIIGLMGDLITCYRDALRKPSNGESVTRSDS
jgi:DNA-binding NarL/FixJ family response regulator